ncbi:MAG: hypothetical protein OEY07_14660 [Gammaproteobacteria bacterium]|nr:hypothetical protein [Gammaproteobacteria bacterium]
MDFNKTIDLNQGRTGKQDRTNPDRYFHVMGQGWYAFTREGIIGPYVTKERAAELLLEHISCQIPEHRKESWRYKPTGR